MAGLKNWLRRIFRRRRKRHDIPLMGGATSLDPLGLMDDMLALIQDVDRAAASADARFRRQVLRRVEELYDKCRQFAELGDFTYTPIDPTTFARVDSSGRQKLAARMLPLLESMKKQLSG
jgi:hypothetical protein